MSDKLAVSSDATGIAPFRVLVPPEFITRRHGMFPGTSGFSGLVTESSLSGGSPHPYGSWLGTVVDIPEGLLSVDGLDTRDVIEKVVVDRGELMILIARGHIVRVAKYLWDDNDLRFGMCLDINGVHYPSDKGRELYAIYPFWSITHNRTICLEATCPNADPHIPSIVSIYPGNDWQERGTWDLIDIVFDGHPSLMRTALLGGWIGHPQRKDYPLGGIPIEYKGATIAPADTRRSYK